jgi:hypothetical protein
MWPRCLYGGCLSKYRLGVSGRSRLTTLPIRPTRCPSLQDFALARCVNQSFLPGPSFMSTMPPIALTFPVQTAYPVHTETRQLTTE